MNRIEALRQHMKENSVSAVVIPTADTHLSEYISDCYKLREYISGFTGSAGTLVVTGNDAGLWTDGRYYLQAEKELSGSGIRLFKASEKDCIKISDYLKENLSESDTVGVDGRLFSKKYLDELIAKIGNIKVNTSYRPDEIWKERPEEPMEKVFVLEERYSGESVGDKACKVRDIMKKGGFTHYLVSAPESIMWLLNIRGNDVRYTPVALSYLIMTDKEVTLYINPEKLTDGAEEYLKAHNIKMADYNEVYNDLEKIGENAYLAADYSLTNYYLLGCVTCAKKNIKDFICDLKAIKNNTEIENIKNAYIKENVALTKAFYEIYHSENLNECDITDIIEKHRSRSEGYFSPSFDTIAAFGKNAAMIHYCAKEGKCAKIGENGLLLIDTGGQYYEGTTDTTRTLVIGNISDEEKEMLTLVLKGHLAVQMVVFPDGTRFSELEALARIPLWKKGLDFRHSTGHGIGYMLAIHEGPHRLSSKCDDKIKVNMTLSDEPGVYIEEKFGIRIENHLYVKDAFSSEYGKYLCFETLNYCPIGTEGIMPSLMTNEEKEWLNAYNEKCRELIIPHLTKEEAEWLRAYTKVV